MGLGAKATAAELRELLQRLKLQVAQAEQQHGGPDSYLLTAAGKHEAQAEEEDPNGDEPVSSLKQWSVQEPSVKASSTLQYNNGDKYEGAVLDGSMRHGLGTHTCLSGDVYEGNCRLDERHGQGVFTAKDGTSYEGTWQHDKAHGQGTATYADGSRYEGEWQQGNRHGWGKFWTAAGEHCEGEWQEDMMHGNGRWVSAGGHDVFEGRYCQGQRIQGRLVQGDLEYEGGFEAGQPHGQGVGTLKGAWTYNGTWAAALRQGQGECRYIDGGHYSGSWLQDLRHGTGVLKLPGGFVYKGNWRKDKPHGTGSCQYDTGERYTGKWHEGKRHGQGRCLSSNGDRYEGSWAADERAGEGVCVYADGSRYQGSWQAGKRHGQGFATFADGMQFRGMWDDDAWVQSAADPKLTRLKGPGLARAVAGQEASFTIQARDDANNRRLSGGDAFCVVLEGADGAEVARGHVVDNEDGTYLASYQLTTAGPHHIHVLAGDGEPVADSPYPVLVLPGKPVARHCSAAGAGCSTATAGKAATFCVRARDAHGNDCSEAGAELSRLLKLQAQLVQGNQVLLVKCEAAASGGLFTCTYTPSQPGLHVLEVTACGRHIKGSPFSIKVQPQLELAPAPHSQQPNAAVAPGGHLQKQLAQVHGDSIVDQVAWWGRVARAEYAVDGSLAGFDSDGEEGQQDANRAPEESYIKANPNVAVVERMEDLWRLSKLQQERQRPAPQQQPMQQKGTAAAQQLPLSEHPATASQHRSGGARGTCCGTSHASMASSQAHASMASSQAHASPTSLCDSLLPDAEANSKPLDLFDMD